MEEDLAETTKKTEWYEEFGLEDLKLIIRANILSASRSFIEIGYYLKSIRDRELYREEGYQTVWEFAQEEYGISKSTASRYMAMNDRFSQGGNSPFIAESYKDFDKSKLQEMLYLTESQREQVTPDMKVQEIRELRREKEVPYYPIEGQLDLMTDFPEILPEKENDRREAPEFLLDLAELMEVDVATVATQEIPAEALLPDPLPPLSAYGTPKKVYPEKYTYIETPGCEGELGGLKGSHNCFSCAMKCQIRQEYRYCVGATMGTMENPFLCDRIDRMEEIEKSMGSRCQFANPDLAWHRPGDGEPDPCCKNCDEGCDFRCERAKNMLPVEAGSEREKEEKEPDGLPEAREVKTYDRNLLEQMISKAEHEMEVMGEYWREDLPKCYTQKAMEIQAYKTLMGEHDAAESVEADQERSLDREQPELPVFKNDNQRKSWIKNYKDWGLWYRDEHIDVNYYKFDFENGSRLVAVEYPQRESTWNSEPYDSVFYHLIEKNKQKYGCMNTYDDKFQCHGTSETDLVNYLKKIQKKKEGGN